MMISSQGQGWGWCAARLRLSLADLPGSGIRGVCSDRSTDTILKLINLSESHLAPCAAGDAGLGGGCGGGNRAHRDRRTGINWRWSNHAAHQETLVMKRIALRGSKPARLFALLLVFIASFALLAWGLRDELVAAVVWGGETIEEAPVWGAVIFFFASAFSVLFLFLSSVLLVPWAILAWGKWPTFLILATGWLCGWMATYAVGRFFRNRAFVEKKLSSQHVTDSLLSGKLPFSLVLIVVSSLPAEIVGYALGAVRYPFRMFFLALILVEVPFAFLLVFIGESFFQENIGLLVALMLLLLGILAWELKNARRMRQRDG
ncbi:MAG: hypothetical protein B7X82_09180 [Hydrogenophilales bacterium 17-64-65]|nr:MAG: hypothetical protein B7Y27_08910 [Hydrogenophilales bacterium 16-64-40]OZA33537.1 MAG: hypothetical protein B7X82_09180 [Hydrogenophilales bacterium 17-64-65]